MNQPDLEQVVGRVLAALTALENPNAQDVAAVLTRLPARADALEMLINRALEARWAGVPLLRAGVEHVTRMASPATMLVALLDNPNPGVVVSALEGLTHLGQAVPSELVTRLLYRPEEAVKEHALAFLGRSEPARVLEVLRGMALVNDVPARKRAAFVLGEMAGYAGTLRLGLEMLATEESERVLAQLGASLKKHVRPRTLPAILGPLSELRAAATGPRHVALTRMIHDVALDAGLSEADVVRIARTWLDRSQVMRKSAGYRRGRANTAKAQSNVEKLSEELTGSQIVVRPARTAPAAGGARAPRTPAFAAALAAQPAKPVSAPVPVPAPAPMPDYAPPLVPPGDAHAAPPPPPPAPRTTGTSRPILYPSAAPAFGDPDGPDLPPLKSSRPVEVPQTPRKVAEVDAVKDWLNTPGQPRNSRKTRPVPALEEPGDSALMPVLKIGLGFAAIVITARLVAGPSAPRPSPPPRRPPSASATRPAPPPTQAATPPPTREDRPVSSAGGGGGPPPAEDMVQIDGEVVEKITGLVIVKTDTASYEVQTTDPKVPDKGNRYKCKGYLLEKPQPGKLIRVIAVR